jgi:hypothetical protein
MAAPALTDRFISSIITGSETHPAETGEQLTILAMAKEIARLRSLNRQYTNAKADTFTTITNDDSEVLRNFLRAVNDLALKHRVAAAVCVVVEGIDGADINVAGEQATVNIVRHLLQKGALK